MLGGGLVDGQRSSVRRCMLIPPPILFLSMQTRDIWQYALAASAWNGLIIREEL